MTSQVAAHACMQADIWRPYNHWEEAKRIRSVIRSV